MRRLRIDGSRTLVTGAANGIGRALAAALVERGGQVALADVDAEAVAAAADALGPRAHAVTLDVRDHASCVRGVEAAVEALQRLDVVVANAGITSVFGTLASLPHEDYERVVDVNLLGVHRTLRAAHPYVSRTRGHVLATSSTASGFHSPLQGHYAASKAGVLAVANSYRQEVRHLGVTVGVLHPTFVSKHDDLVDDELGAQLWGGNEDGSAWGRVPLDTVVERAVDGIARRRRTVVVPRAVSPVVWMSGLLQPLLERSFDEAHVERLARASRRRARTQAGADGSPNA